MFRAKILMVNKFHYPFGGPETCLFATKRLFEESGHKVFTFSMRHPRNIPSPQEKYFTEQLELSYTSGLNPLKKLRLAAKIIYSFEAKSKISALIESEKPDIAHLHSIYHQLTPSIITPLYKAGIPIVMTLHDYQQICLNYKMLQDNRICEACIRQQFWRAIPAKCVKGSYSKTLVDYIEHQVHRFLRLYSKINLFITPSEFSHQLHVRMGMDPKRFITIENFIELKGYSPKYEHRGYILFFGRLAKEKGVETLVRAMAANREVPLKIAGDGPEEKNLMEITSQLGLKNIEFVGFKTGDSLTDLIKNCAFAIVPSEWYENCSMTILEAFAYGKAVIGADIGGIPEQIIHGKNGFLFRPGDTAGLAESIRLLYQDDRLIREMGTEARRTVETKYSSERHYTRLLSVYTNLIDSAKKN